VSRNTQIQPEFDTN